MYTFDRFIVGQCIGSHAQTLDQDLVSAWLRLFPRDAAFLPTMPLSMVSAISMRDFLQIVQPRPKGNVHATQKSEVHRLPVLGEELRSFVVVQEKFVKRDTNRVVFEVLTRDAAGGLLFAGRAGIIWAA